MSHAPTVQIPRWLAATLQRPKLVIVSCLIFCLLCALGFLRISLTADYRVFFSEDNPQLKAFQDQETRFLKSDSVVYGVKGDIFSVGALQLIADISKAAESLPRAERVESLTNFRVAKYGLIVDKDEDVGLTAEEIAADAATAAADAAFLAEEGEELDEEDEEDVEDDDEAWEEWETAESAAEYGVSIRKLLEDDAKLDATLLKSIKEQALNEPALMGQLVSTAKFGHQAAAISVIVQIPEDADLSKEVPKITEAGRKLIDSFRERATKLDLELYELGIIPFNQTLMETTYHDLMYLFPFSIAAMMMALLFMLHGFRPMLITGCIILASVVTAVGLACGVGTVFNTVTAVSPIIIMTLAIAHSVHLFVNFHQNLNEYSEDAKFALGKALEVNFQPVTLTSLTTVIGFLSLNFSDAPPFREMGNIVALGVAASWFFAIVLLPALVQVLGVGDKIKEDKPSPAMDRLGGFVVRFRHPLLVMMLAICIPVILMAPQNRINDVFREWFGPSNDIRQGMEFSLDEIGGLEILHYTLDSGKRDGIKDPAFIKDVEKLENWLRKEKQAEVHHINSYIPLLKRLNQAFHEDDKSKYVVPDTRESASNHITFYNTSQPKGHSAKNIWDNAKQSTRMNIKLKRLKSSDIKQLDREILAYIKKELPNITTPGASGISMMFAELGYRNITQMLQGTIAALMLISLILIVALRSVKIGLISMVPNIVPAALGFGVWYQISGEINLAIATVMGMTMGIVVDDTIHFLSKYHRARQVNGLNTFDAIRYSFHQVGQALWATTIVLIGGFLVLGFSDFLPTQDIGFLTAIIIGLALFADFLLLPPLLMLIDRGRSKQPIARHR